MANALRFSCKGRVGFIDWLDRLQRFDLALVMSLRAALKDAQIGTEQTEADDHQDAANGEKPICCCGPKSGDDDAQNTEHG